MAQRAAEIALVCVASGLLLWGMIRAINRGEPAVNAWTTYVMIGLAVLCSINIYVRSAGIGRLVVMVSAFFLVLVVLAALLGAPAENLNRLPAIARAVLFFAMVGGAGVLQWIG